VGHKINFLSIGEGPDLPSILYFEIFGQTKDEIKNFINVMKEKAEQFNLEYDIIKNNIN
jgi:hypothetical protein